MAGEKKQDEAGATPDAAEVEALKAQVATLTKDKAALQEKVDTLTLSNENLVAMKENNAQEIAAAHEIIDELKAKIAGYEAQPETDSSGQKVHTLKGTKRKFQLVFGTTLRGTMVDDASIAADNSLLSELVKMQSGAIREVSE